MSSEGKEGDFFDGYLFFQMKMYGWRWVGLAVLLGLAPCFLRAQSKIAVVDLQAVLQQMPAYKKIAEQIDKMARDWQEEIKREEKVLRDLKDAFVLEEPFFTDQIKKLKREELDKQEEKVLSLNTRYFGFEGLYFQKKQELTKPLQDKVYDVIERVAQDRKLEVVIDKSAAGSLILYITPRLDITLRVLQLLGL